RVVVTGMGMISPVGNTVDSTWQALLAGQSGVELIEHFDTAPFATRFAAMVKDFNGEDYNISRKDARKMDYFIQYGIAAGMQAMQDAGIEITEENAERIGCAIGSGIADTAEHRRLGYQWLVLDPGRKDLIEELMEIPCLFSL
ncbi:3-oxoacyl-(acyl-carrier-protein) synthase, partial [Gilliamella apicola SCGC AB-598-I20]